MAQSLGEYLRELRGTMSLREASKATGGKVSHSTIAQAEKGRNSRGATFTPSPETLQKLAAAYNANPMKLLEKAGYITNMNELLDPGFEEKKRIIKASDDNKNRRDSIYLHPGNFTVSNKEIDVYGEIHAGDAAWADEDIIGSIPVTNEFLAQYGGIKNLFALRIKGDSMNRRIPNGYIGVFCKELEIEDGDVVAVLIDGDNATIKEFHKTSKAVIFSPDSYDPSYRSYTFKKDDPQDYLIIGKFLYATTQPI